MLAVGNVVLFELAFSCSLIVNRPRMYLWSSLRNPGYTPESRLSSFGVGVSITIFKFHISLVFSIIHVFRNSSIVPQPVWSISCWPYFTLYLFPTL